MDELTLPDEHAALQRIDAVALALLRAHAPAARVRCPGQANKHALQATLLMVALESNTLARRSDLLLALLQGWPV